MIKDDEFAVLNYLLKNNTFKITDLRDVFKGSKNDPQINYLVKKMNERRLLQKTPQSDRKYAFCFNNPILLRGVVEQLASNGFVNN